VCCQGKEAARTRGASPQGSARGDPAVDDQFAAGRVARLVRSQEQNPVGDVPGGGQAAEGALGRRIVVEDSMVRRALDAWSNVLGRQTPGSATPDEARRMVARARATLAGETAWLAENRQRLTAASATLEAATARILATESQSEMFEPPRTPRFTGRRTQIH